MSGKKVLFILAAVFFLLVFSMPGYCNDKPTCAVLMFFPDVESTQMSEIQNFSGQYADLLSRLGLFEVIDYRAVSQKLQEKNITNLPLPCTSKDCALIVGRLLNADYAVYGVIGHIGKLYSLETTLIDITKGTEAQYAVTDFEGTQLEFEATAPTENIKSLFGVNDIPKTKETMQSDIKPAEAAPASVEAASIKEEKEMPEAPTTEKAQPIQTGKKFYITPRIGIGAGNNGVAFGGGLEAQYNHLALQFMASSDGFVSGLSYYLKPNESSPFLSVVGTYYDTENHGVDEIGRIYGLLLGYRLNITEQLNARCGVGAGYVNWDQTELNRDGTKFNDEEYIPIFEASLGYSFGFGSKNKYPTAPPVIETPKIDSDKDGVLDSDDACPDTPIGVSVDAKGCPFDIDNDGVNNDFDKCPHTPEGVKVDARGCWVIPGVLFDTNQPTIKDENAENLLSTVVIVMDHYPDHRYEIQGYTDNVGSAAYNLELSEQRAISVKNYLVSKGIGSDRLTTKGFGLDNPAASNETEEGRASNRRVEIKPMF